MAPHLICSRGHEWDPSAVAAAPATGEPLCPTCGAPAQEPAGRLPHVTGFLELLGELGHGRMGVVYRARQLLHGRVVALELLSDRALRACHDLVAFCAEARRATALDHPGIVPLLEAGDEGGQPYLATELVEGRSLQEVLTEAPLAPREAARAVEALARAVHHAHRHGVLHLGLTPASVLLDRRGAVRLTDFGLSVFLRGKDFPGNPGFAAPEQTGHLSAEPGPLTDVYGLGAVLYALLTDRAPFLAPTTEETLRLVMGQEPTPPGRLEPGLPPDLEYICLKCLDKRPRRRYASALDLAEDLKRFQEGQPCRPKSLALATGLGRWGRHNAAALAVGAVGCVALGIALAANVSGSREAARARQDAAEQRRLAEGRGQQALARRAREASARLKAEQDLRQVKLDVEEERKAHGETRKRLREAEETRRAISNLRQQEADARARAEDRARAADEARQQAQARRQEVARELVKVHVAAGARLLDEGDLVASLPWNARALRLAHQEGLPEDAHRLRLAATLGQCPRPVQVWVHDKGVSAVQLSGDGRHVLTAGADGAATVWDVSTGKRVGDPLKHGAIVTHAVLSPDGKHVLTADENAQVRVWDLAGGKEAFPAVRLMGAVGALAFSPDGKRFLTVSARSAMNAAEGEVRVFDAATGEPVGEALGSQVALRPASFGPDGRRVLTTCTDDCARVWDPITGNQVGAALEHKAAVVQASFSRDGRSILTGSLDGTARVWEAATGKALGRPFHHTAPVTRASFSPDGRYALTAGEDRAVQVWEVATGERVGQAVRHRDQVTGAAFSPDGRHVLTAAADGTVRVLDLVAGEDVVPPLPHNGSVVYAAFGPRGTEVLTFDGRVVRLWDLTTGEPPARERGEETAGGTAFSPDGKRGVHIAKTSAQVYDTGTNKPVGAALEHKQRVRSALFSPDGRRVLTVSVPAGNEETPTWLVRVWDADTGKPVGDSLEHLRDVPDAGFSPDGKRVVTACGDKKVRVWDPATAEAVGKAIDHKEEVLRVLFAPGGKRVLSLDAEGTVRIWEAATGEQVGDPFGHSKPVNHIAFRADGARIITGGDDGLARVWDADTGKAVSATLTHDGPVVYAAFSPDGKYVVTASQDRTARVWEAETGKPATPPLRHRRAVSCAEFSGDGRWLVTAAGDGVRIWDARTGEPVGPPLRHSYQAGKVTRVSLSKDGQLITAGGVPGDPAGRWVRELKPDARPAQDLVRLAGVLAAGEAADDLGESWRTLREKYGKDFGGRAGRVLAWEARGAAECERRGLWAGAALHLGRLIAASSAPGELYGRRARAYAAQRRWERALVDYEKALEGEGRRWDLWSGRGEAAGALGRWDEAVASYSKALGHRGQDRDLLTRRGRAEAERGKWDRAAADLAQAIRLGQNDLAVWRQEALARLAAKDERGYRRLCERLVRRYGGGKDPAVGRSVARTCTLAGDAVADWKPLVRQAEQALASDPESAPDLRRLASLLYRAGDHEGALKRLQEVRKVRGQQPDARVWLLGAMAHQRLGHGEEARTWLAKAADLIDEAEKAGPKDPGQALTWVRRLEYRLLRQEAEALVKGMKP